MVLRHKPHTRAWGKIRPHLWVTGPDPVLHKKYLVWLQQRNQALWREESWHIDFSDWCAIWGDLWLVRGRERGHYCMSRKDWGLPWTVDNVHVITREAHARLQGNARAAGWCSVAQKRNKQRKNTNDSTESTDTSQH
jgi:hypothetical protein